MREAKVSCVCVCVCVLKEFGLHVDAVRFYSDRLLVIKRRVFICLFVDN